MKILIIFGLMIACVPAFAKGATTAGVAKFQLIQLGDYHKDQFLLDTDTGKFWKPVCTKADAAGNCTGTMIWQLQVIEEITMAPKNVNKLIQSDQQQP
ncbi:MAG: hypothetical protein ACXWQO_07985 [Bdellovibrionota bacterium]